MSNRNQQQIQASAPVAANAGCRQSGRVATLWRLVSAWLQVLLVGLVAFESFASTDAALPVSFTTATADRSAPSPLLTRLLWESSLRDARALLGELSDTTAAALAEAPAGDSGTAIGPEPGPGLQRLPGHVLSAALRLATPVIEQDQIPLALDAIGDAQEMLLTLVLARDDQAGFERYLHEVYDPQSKQFRKFLPQTQLTQRYGPTRQHYDAVQDYLRQRGLATVQGSDNRLTLTVRGTRAQVERALAVRIGDYRIGSAGFYANDRDPALPAALAKQVVAISGLSSLGTPQPVIKSTIYQNVCGATKGGGNGGNKNIKQCVSLTNALYGLFRNIICGLSTIALAAGRDPLTFGTGVIITIACNASDLSTSLGDLGTAAGGGLQAGRPPSLRGQPGGGVAAAAVDGSGQTVGLVEFDTFRRSDVEDYLALIGAPASRIDNLSVVPVNGGVASPGSGETEVLLDIDAIMTLAPSARVAVYHAPFDGRASSYSSVFNAMINDGVNIISNSWASCEDQLSQADAMGLDAVLQTAAASGIGVFNAVGDSGSTCLDGRANTVSIPASSPNATAVGGTSWPQGPGLGQTYGVEQWWDGSNDVPATGQGGYGLSRFFARPAYQSAVQGGAMRSVPDVVIRADPANGVVICQASAGGCPSGTLNGGTSLAAPEWAAVAALLNQAQGRNLGALNPLLYPLAATEAFHGATALSSDFQHVGLGSPNLNALNRRIKGQAAPGLPDATNSQVVRLVQPVNDSLQPDGSFVAPADGSSQSGVRVALFDRDGNSVPGKSVQLTASGGSASFVSGSTLTTDSNGVAVFTLTNRSPETIHYSATDVTDGITLSQTADVVFGVPSAASAGLNVFPTSVTADGVSSTSLSITLKDALDRPTPGKRVRIAQGSGHSVISGPNPAVTDSNGQITFTATNDVNETVSYSAFDVSDGDLPIPGAGDVVFSSAGPTNCTSNPPVAAAGFAITPFASGFPAGDFSFSNINFGGCPGAVNPYFDASGSVLIPDFRTGDVYTLGSAGGSVTPGDVLANLGPSISTPVYGRDGSIYASRFGTGGGFTTGDIVQIDPASGAILRTLASNLTCPGGLSADPLSGDLFFDGGCFGAGSDVPSLFRIIDPANNDPARPTALVTYATLPRTGNGPIVFAPDGTIYVVTGVPAVYSEPYQIAKVGGTNTAQPATVTVLSGIATDNGALAVGQTNADGSAKTLIVHQTPTGDSTGGKLLEVDISGSLPVAGTVFATGDIGYGTIGPDGCVYIGTHHVVFRLASSSGVCTLTPTSPGPQLSLSPATVAASLAQGSVQTFTATLRNVAAPAGLPVLFAVTGANPQVRLVRADANGQAVFTYTAAIPGVDSVTASTSIANPQLQTSSASGRRPAPVLQPATQKSPATTVMAQGPGSRLLNSGAKYPAVTARPAAKLRASTSVVAADTVSATIPLLSNTVELTWTTGAHLSFLSLNTSPTGGTVSVPVIVVGALADVSPSPATPAANQTVRFALTSGGNCTAITDVRGLASCALTPSVVGPDTLTANFDGTAALVASSASASFNVMPVPAATTGGTTGGTSGGTTGGSTGSTGGSTTGGSHHGGAVSWPLSLCFALMALRRRRRNRPI